MNVRAREVGAGAACVITADLALGTLVLEAREHQKLLLELAEWRQRGGKRVIWAVRSWFPGRHVLAVRHVEPDEAGNAGGRSCLLGLECFEQGQANHGRAAGTDERAASET